METSLTSFFAFVSTNLDDLFLLVLFFGNPAWKGRDIALGQYGGIMLLTGISLMASWLGYILDPRYIGLLGLFPIYLGLKQIMGTREGHRDGNDIHEKQTGALSVALVTVANGGDNIGTYIPLFTSMTGEGKTIMVAWFMGMTALWLFLARYLARHPWLAGKLERHGPSVISFVLCILGLYILKANGSFGLFS